MSGLRKILISLPDDLIKELDSFISIEKMNRNELVRKALELYINKAKNHEAREKMKKGYQEMAEINILLAEMCVEADNDQQIKYEKRLGELDR